MLSGEVGEERRKENVEDAKKPTNKEGLAECSWIVGFWGTGERVGDSTERDAVILGGIIIEHEADGDGMR
jgi:hypothetical protein